MKLSPGQLVEPIRLAGENLLVALRRDRVHHVDLAGLVGGVAGLDVGVDPVLEHVRIRLAGVRVGVETVQRDADAVLP